MLGIRVGTREGATIYTSSRGGPLDAIPISFLFIPSSAISEYVEVMSGKLLAEVTRRSCHNGVNRNLSEKS